MPNSSRDYLTLLLDQYWFAPPVALWRAIELRMLAEEVFRHPILDLGCGDGLIAQVLFTDDARIDYGFDPWFSQVRQVPLTHTYHAVQQALGHAIPYRDSQFATVFSNSVLEHIVDLVPVLEEAIRVLMPGGRLIATVPSDAFRSFLAGYQACAGAGDIDGAEAYASMVDSYLEHYRYLSPEAWSELFENLGLQLVSSKYYIPFEVASVWDRANRRYGIYKHSVPIYRWLASPRLRKLGYQKWVKRSVVNRLSVRWRHLYEMSVPPESRGAGLLIIAEKVGT
jgi:SAM-dependent methyltransferase